MYAPAPITGGTSAPPELAAASDGLEHQVEARVVLRSYGFRFAVLHECEERLGRGLGDRKQQAAASEQQQRQETKTKMGSPANDRVRIQLKHLCSFNNTVVRL